MAGILSDAARLWKSRFETKPNIAVSRDLLDRMYETVSGPELRDWCQSTGLLPEGADFADKRAKDKPITVRAARTFVMNFLDGREIDGTKFESSRTTPRLASTGSNDPEWAKIKADNPKLWDDPQLVKAGKEFAQLIQAQQGYFSGKGNSDYANKATNYAVLSAWAYTAGVLSSNPTRIKRHYALRTAQGKDPLNAAVLAKGRHKSDPDNYRGLGFRTDPKERGRFVELFFAQSGKGGGITKQLVEVAIRRYHAKQAMLEAKEAEEKL